MMVYASFEDKVSTDGLPTLNVEALPGYRPAKAMVYAGFYPVDADEYENVRDAMSKLVLNDASFHFGPESSAAMGSGFRCGFLGLLHMDIVQERLEREYNLNIIVTSPSVVYKARPYSASNDLSKEVLVDCPSKLPDLPGQIIEEPYVRLELIAPSQYLGDLMALAQSRRGLHKDLVSLSENRMMLVYEVRFVMMTLFAVIYYHRCHSRKLSQTSSTR
jgi:translation elongation factor EF-4